MDRRTRVLVVDDDRDFTDVVSISLECAGYSVSAAFDGGSALVLKRTWKPHLIILDLRLPGQSGHAVCREIRRSDPDVGILVVSCMRNEEDKVLALELGADDFLEKPHSNSELLARLKVLSRRSAAMKGDGILSVGGLILHDASREVYFHSQKLMLTPTEFELLKCFMNSPDRVFDRTHLSARGLGSDESVNERTLDVHVRNLRRKIPSRHPCIVAVRGVGYRLDSSDAQLA